MNFIAYDKAYSLYPKRTFITRQSLVLTDRILQSENALQKYETRGWVIVYAAKKMVNDSKSRFGAKTRQVGDSKCWTIPILPKLDLPLSTVEGNTWTLHLSRATISRHDFSVVWLRRSCFTAAPALVPCLHLGRDNLNDDDQ